MTTVIKLISTPKGLKPVKVIYNTYKAPKIVSNSVA